MVQENDECNPKHEDVKEVIELIYLVVIRLRRSADVQIEESWKSKTIPYCMYYQSHLFSYREFIKFYSVKHPLILEVSFT